MSVRIMSDVWDKFPGNGSELLAMLALADWANDDGFCWPSIAAIARKLRLSERQAQRVIHGLIEQDFVAVVGNCDGGAPGCTRQYQVQVRVIRGGMHVTGDMGVRGDMDDTGDMGDVDGCHGCRETGDMGVTQTIIEPSKNHHIHAHARLGISGNPPPKPEPKPKPQEIAFEQFWKAYPKKTGKEAARKSWVKAKPPVQDVLRALQWQCNSEQWTKDHGQYIPNPATYLNQGRWQDEPASELQFDYVDR